MSLFSRVFFAFAALLACVPWVGGFLSCLLLPLAVLHDFLRLAYRLGFLQFMIGVGVGADRMKRADDSTNGSTDFDGFA